MRHLILALSLLAAGTTLAQDPPPAPPVPEPLPPDDAPEDDLPPLDDDDDDFPLPTDDEDDMPPPDDEPLIEEVPFVDEIARIAKRTQRTITVDPRLKDRQFLPVTFKNIPWREELEIVAKVAGDVEVIEREDGSLHVEYVPSVTLRSLRVPVEDALSAVTKANGLTLTKHKPLPGKLIVNVNSLPWRDALQAIAYAATFEAKLEGQALSVRPLAKRPTLPEPQGPRFRDFVPDDSGPLIGIKATKRNLVDVLDEIGQQLEKDILVDPELDPTLTINLPEAPWGRTLASLATQRGLEITEVDGALIFSRRLFLQARSAPADLLLVEAAELYGYNLVAGPRVGGAWSVDFEGSHRGLFAALTEANGCTAQRLDDDLVLVVGQAAQPAPAPRSGGVTWKNFASRAQAWGRFGAEPNDAFVLIDQHVVRQGETLRIDNEEVKLMAVDPQSVLLGSKSRKIQQIELPLLR